MPWYVILDGKRCDFPAAVNKPAVFTEYSRQTLLVACGKSVEVCTYARTVLKASLTVTIYRAFTEQGPWVLVRLVLIYWNARYGVQRATVHDEYCVHWRVPKDSHLPRKKGPGICDPNRSPKLRTGVIVSTRVYGVLRGGVCT